MVIDNFDSGPGLEDIVREEIRHICPHRYSVQRGVINDSSGRTAGDFDVILFNDLWFPAVKSGATPESRRIHLPIEGVYGIVEVKQSLDYKRLDDAMHKLVTGHRLHRPRTYANRLVENRDLDSCFHGLTNPLYSAVLATDLAEGADLDKLVERFFDINKSLKRLEVIRALCVLGHGTVTWVFWDDNGDLRPTLFMRDDLFHPIIPSYHKSPPAESAFYVLMSDILLHLYHVVLGAEDISVAYGIGHTSNSISIPQSPEVILEPDVEWIQSLDLEYDQEYKRVPRNREGLPLVSEEHVAKITAMRLDKYKNLSQRSDDRATE